MAAESVGGRAQKQPEALVGGGLAAKAGLFAKLGIALLAAKKFILVLVLGTAALVKRWFARKGGGTVR